MYYAHFVIGIQQRPHREREREMEEVFVAMKVASSIVLAGIFIWILYVYGNQWHKCLRVRRKLRMQGIQGPPPSFLHGNLPDMQRIKAQASKVASDSHSHQFQERDFTASLFPYFEHWRKQYGTLLCFFFFLIIL